MARPPHILAARPILNRQHALGDHLARIRPDNMNPQNPIRLGVGVELDEAVGVEGGLGARVGAEGETAGLELDAGRFQLGFVLADPGDFGVRVHDAGDGAVVDVAVAFLDVFDRGDGFLLGFVREHGAEGAVADDADVGEFGPVLLVDDEPAFVVDFEADVFEAEACGVGSAADSDEDDVCVELVGRLVVDSYV